MHFEIEITLRYIPNNRAGLNKKTSRLECLEYFKNYFFTIPEVKRRFAATAEQAQHSHTGNSPTPTIAPT